jgi:hypothetical protein
MDLAFSLSKDGGQTWTPPRRINPPESTGVFLPTLAVGPTGRVAVRYNDLRRYQPRPVIGPGDRAPAKDVAPPMLASEWVTTCDGDCDVPISWKEHVVAQQFRLDAAARADDSFDLGDYGALLVTKAGGLLVASVATNQGVAMPSPDLTDIFFRRVAP